MFGRGSVTTQTACRSMPTNDAEPEWLVAWRGNDASRQRVQPGQQRRSQGDSRVSGTHSDKRTTAQGFSEPQPWAKDGGIRREPVLDMDRHPPIAVRYVGWRSCMRCQRPFWSEDVVRLRICDRCKMRIE